jgi:hypothetical protein
MRIAVEVSHLLFAVARHEVQLVVDTSRRAAS